MMQSKIWWRESPSPLNRTTSRLSSAKFWRPRRASWAIFLAFSKERWAMSALPTRDPSSIMCGSATGTLFLDDCDHTIRGMLQPSSA